jgi:hypothetical protein
MLNKMKLYEVPRNSWIKFEDALYLFHKIDGMYSVCSHQGQIVHLAAWCEVEFIGEFEGFGNEDRTSAGFGEVQESTTT